MKNLITELLENGKKMVDAAKRPFIIEKLKRSFESAISSAREKVVDNELKIQELRLKLVDDPETAGKVLNDIVECKAAIRKAKLTAEILEEEEKEMFEVKK